MIDNDNESFENDAYICMIGAKIIEQESKPAVINPRRILEMQRVYDMMIELASDSTGIVTYSLHKPFRSMGSVTVSLTDVKIMRSDLIIKSIKIADNIDIYPLLSGGIRLVFTFHGLVKTF